MNLRFIVVAGLFFFLTSCSSTIKVVSEYPKPADFSQFHTYQFIPAEKIPSSNFNFTTFQQGLIQDAIEVEMEKRGYIESLNNDLLIKVQGNIAFEQERTNYDPYGVYPYGRSGRYYRDYDNREFERTMIIIVDLIDVANQHLVWHAEAIQELRKKDHDVETKILEGIKAIFEQYPYRAGSKKLVDSK